MTTPSKTGFVGVRDEAGICHCWSCCTAHGAHIVGDAVYSGRRLRMLRAGDAGVDAAVCVVCSRTLTPRSIHGIFRKSELVSSEKSLDKPA